MPTPRGPVSKSFDNVKPEIQKWLLDDGFICCATPKNDESVKSASKLDEVHSGILKSVLALRWPFS
jgi:hypothetical protein